MSYSAQADAFFRDVATTRTVWTVRDARGYPAPQNSRGVRTQPFWSSKFQVERVINTIPAYRGFVSVELSWVEFRDKWLPDLEQVGMAVGVNWSGLEATGVGLQPGGVRDAVEWQIEHLKREGRAQGRSNP